LRRQPHDVIFLPVFSAFEGGMLRQKPIVISLALAGLIAATDTSALGLGRLNVTTALGQPLVAEVDLSIAPGDDFDSIRANIATPAVYRGANVEYQGILQTIRVQPLRRANGQPFLRLTSNQAVNEPFLDVLIEVNSNTGRLVREFVVLLDPAGTAQPQAIDATTNPRATITSPAPSAPPSSVASAPRAPSVPRAAAAPAAPASANASGGGYTVKGGDTLYAIASKNNPGGVSIEQLMIAIQRANPGAFIGGNINRLRSGANLNLPTASEAGAIATNDAVSEVRAQTASWRGYVSRISENVPTVASDSAQARASGKVSGTVSDTATSGPATDKLKLSQGERSKSAAAESKVATGKAIKEEQAKAAELEKTKQNLEKALSLKSQTMAETQAKAKEAAKPASPPAPAVAAPTPAPTPAPAAPPPAVAAAATAPPAPAPTPPAPAVEAPAPAPAPVAATPVAPPPPAPAPAPAVTKAPPPAPEADSGIMGFITENPLIPAGGLAALLLGLGGLMWSRRRNAAKSLAPDSRMSEPVVNTVNPDTVFGTSGLGVVKTNDAPIASQFSRSGMGTIDAGEVDPVAEAEVYIAYGREAQAEEILREALARDPQRADVATKLAEMAAVQGDQSGFDKWVADIGKMERGREYQSRLGELAAAHFPNHGLASGVSAAAAQATGFVQGAASSAKDAGLSALATGGAVAAAGAAAVAATAASASDAAASFFTATPAPSAPSKAASPDKGGLDFVLDGMTIAAPSSMDKGVPTVIPTIKPGDSSKKKSLEDDLADLEASLKKATSTGQLPESSMDFTDFSTATPTNLGTVGPAMRPEMLDLSFDAGRSGTMEPTPSILDGQWHDAATKLDLARAYEEMGDQEGAREILREVIHDGDETQKAEARALLTKLGG
jgi:pilus assembly protein FimV